MNDQNVLEELDQILAKSARFREGRVLGSMCSEPDPIVLEVFRRSYDLNAGDPGLSQGLVELENDAIRMMGEFWRWPQASGKIVSGGTEANILALWSFREGRRSPQQTQVLVSKSRHFSIDKAAKLLGLDLVLIDCNENGQVDLDQLQNSISRRTLAVVAVAGSTSLGLVDELRALGRIAFEHGLFCHVDASFGGFVIPFLEEAGFAAVDFGLDLEGISSVCLDPHKMGRAPIPAGCLLWKDAQDLERLEFSVPYLSGGQTRLSTLLGTRPGFTVAAVWAVLKKLGKSGYVELVRRSLSLTHWFSEQVSKRRHLRLVRQPVLNVVGLAHRKLNPQELAYFLRREGGWALSVWPEFLRVVLMPHVDRTHLEDFLAFVERHLEKE